MAEQNNRTTGRDLDANAVASKLRQEMMDATGTTESKIDQATDKARQGADRVVEEAQEQASRAVDSATNQAGAMVGEFQKQASAMMSQRLDEASSSIGSVAKALQVASNELRNQDQGAIAQYADMAADRVDGLAQYIRSGDLNSIVQDVERFARREPAMFVGGALALGIALSRFFKSSQPASQRSYARSGYSQSRYPIQEYDPATGRRGGDGAGQWSGARDSGRSGVEQARAGYGNGREEA